MDFSGGEEINSHLSLHFKTLPQRIFLILKTTAVLKAKYEGIIEKSVSNCSARNRDCQLLKKTIIVAPIDDPVE